MIRTAAALLLTSALAHQLAGADDFESERLNNWHQWRGPAADGVAPRGNPPIKWSETTGIRWKAEIPGSGSSTPIVWGNRVFLLTAIDTGRPPVSEVKPVATEESALGGDDAPVADAPAPNERARGGRRGGRRGGASLSIPTPTTLYQFEVICLDLGTGEQLWRRTAVEAVPHEGHHPSHGYASASPVTDGRRLIASFGSRGIFCYDLDGQLLWSGDLGDMETKRGFGEGASPALHGDSLVVNWDHEGDSFIACLDANTGDERWRTPREEQTTWNTPLVVEHKGAAQVIVNATGRTRSYNLASGELIWQCGGQVENPIPSPVAHNGIAYAMTGYQGYAITAISLDAKGDVTNSDKVAWKSTAAAPYVASPLLYDDLLYFTKGDAGIIACVDARTGKAKYGLKRLDGLATMYASPVGAAGRVYLTDRDGVTLVLEHAPHLNVLATNKIDEHVNASPVIVGDLLLLRGDKHLYCFSD